MCKLVTPPPVPGTRRGSALVLSLVAVMVLASLGAGLLQLHTAIDRRHEFGIDRRRALYLAEAGIGEAALAVSQGKSGNIASEAIPASFGGGVYWVEADDLPDNRIVLRCTARVSTAEFVVRSLILPNVNPVTRLGFFGSDGLTIGWGSIVDGYHSGRGDFASQVDPSLAVPSTGAFALIGSDADIKLDEADPAFRDGGPSAADELGSSGEWDTLAADAAAADATETGTNGGASDTVPAAPSSPTYIFGQLRPGSSSRVQSGGRSLIDGEILPYEAPPTLPMVTLPVPDEKLLGSLTIAADRTGIGAQVQTWVEDDVHVTGGARLTVTGPAVLRCRSLVVGDRSNLILDATDGPIHIYSEEGFDFGAGSNLFTPAEESTSRGVYLLVSGAAQERDRVTLQCSGKFHGAIYAPSDIVRIPADLRVLGSVVARVVVTEPGAHISFDRRLGLGGDGWPALPRQLSWQVVPLGDEVARHLPIDPLMALALRGVTPVPSSRGSIESDVEIQYVDGSGSAASYAGSITAFDPRLATRIVGARWTDPRDGSVRTWTTPAGSESTGALAALRDDLQEMRAVLQDASPALDVATLSDDEATLEVTLSVAGLDLALAPTAVQWAVQRVDATEVSLTPDPDLTATRSASTAREYADLAAEARITAAALPAVATNPDAPALLNALNRAEDDAARAANDADSKLALTLSVTGAAKQIASDDTVAFTTATIDATTLVLDLLAQLEALTP
ncbi:hypothetical protein Poly30_26390 [Planctomycetes bacterium Poly30]|uniref:DUF7305 domain-containing protein n=1 Tax=Saltatorellus ferox TaxID=2528018 RepID=A0A518ESP7_9BACT|nr:hypothetical protein Poly30_26390 [Planctomycetes bacterium Poly30]